MPTAAFHVPPAAHEKGKPMLGVAPAKRLRAQWLSTPRRGIVHIEPENG
jgi:hypothetical protein